MANHPSAAKRHRQNIKRNARNTGLRSKMRNAVRAARAAIESGSEERQDRVAAAVRIIQKTASKRVIHRNTASRYVSRLTRANREAQKQS